MLSHNNWEEQIKKYEPKKQRFTIKKLSVGVASVLLGVTFAAGTASADSTTANADSASGSDSAEQTDHNLTLNSASTSTLKSATAENQSNNASAAVQNPAGDIKAQAANDYEAAVSAAVANASSEVASDAAQNSASAVQNSAAQNTSATSSSAQASAASAIATQSFTVSSSAVNNNLNYASVFASLAAMPQANTAAQSSATNATANNDEYSGYKTVTDWNGLQSAVLSGAQGVNIKGNITPGWFGNSDLNINGNFTIHGVDGAVLNLGQNKINNNGQLTLADVTVNGSIMGNGTVNIKGAVTSNVNSLNSSVPTQDQYNAQNYTGSRTNFKNSNIAASRVNIENGASLTINSSEINDGINLADGGTVKVGDNATLNVNLTNSSTTATRYHVAGVFAKNGGNFISGYKSNVNFNTGLGQAIAIGATRPTVTDSDRFGGYGARSRNDGPTLVQLGDSSTFNFTGRDGIILGNNANFISGENSNVHFENKGRGVALDLANNSNIEISKHSTTYFHSVGKTGTSGSYDGYNYIGVNEGGNITVDEYATFRVILEGRGDNPWDDVISLDSRNANTNAAFTSKTGAIVDIRDDNTNFYAELISFPLGSANSRIDIQDPLMLNLQRYSNGGATTGWMATGGDMINTTSSQYTSNLIYMSGSKGVFSVSGGDYDPSNPNSSGFVVYQQIKSDGSKQIWLNVNSVDIPMNGFQTKDIWNNQANPDVSIAGNGLTAGIKANQVHNFDGSPLTGSNAPYYGISTQRASHQIWIPHRTPLEITGNHTNTIKYVDEQGNEIFPENTASLNLKRNIILDITQEQIKKIQDYALNHTADETLEYIKNSQSVAQDSGWKFTNGSGQTVTDPYATVESPKLDGYTATIQSTNVQGLKVGEDGSSVTAKFAIDPSEDIVQNGELSDSYKNNGITGIPDNYVTVVVYKHVEKGSVKVVYHDDTTNTTIDGYGYDSKEQDAGTKVDYKTQPSIDELTSKGYVYVTTDGTVPSEVPTNDVTVTVHLKHGLEDVNKNNPHDQVVSATVTRNVNYTVNGQTSSQLPAKTESVDFSATGHWDKVLNQLVDVVNGNIVTENGQVKQGSLTWTPDSASLKGYAAPTLAGYHVDSVSATQNGQNVTDQNVDGNGVVKNVTVNHNDKDINVTVNLINNAEEKANLKIVDDTTGQTLDTLKAQGDENTPISFTNGDSTVQRYLNKGYKFVSVVNDQNGQTLSTTDYASANFGNYDTDADTDQSFTVHLVHGTKPVNPNNPDNNVDPSQYTKDVKETVHYVISDDKVAAPNDKVQTSKWTRTVTVDEVTHKIVPNGQYDTDWTIADGQKKNYDEVVSPDVPGYHPDQNSIAATPVTQDDIYKIVVYSPNGTTIKNQQTIHTSATVHYEGAGDQTPADNVQNGFDFVYSGDTYDAHTNQKLSDGTWNATEHAYNAVDVPNVDGYHTEITVVPASDLTVTRDNPEVTVTVKYVKNGEEVVNKQNLPASQTVQYVGEDGNALLPEKKQTAEFNYSGDTKDSVTGQITKQGSWNETNHNFTAEEVPVIDGYVAVSGYTNEGGKYVAGGFNASNTGSDADRNKVFKVVYKKVGKIIPVDPERKPIPDAPTPTYTNDPQDPTKVTPNEKTPDVPGYIPSVPTVTPTDPTKDTPVVYNQVKDQKALVNYVDADEGNKVITTSGDLSGKAGDKIDYSTATTIQDLENKGYVLVNDGFPADATYDNDDGTVQTYTVVLRHGTQPVTPTNPGKPGEPINPNDPDGPKWPDGTDENSLKKTGTQTIHYVYADGSKVKDDDVKHFDFTKTGVVDKVTGKLISETDWNVSSHTFSRVDSPVIEGYHADKRVAGGETVTPDDLNKEVTVTYTPNGKIIPVDPTGKPIPDVPQPQYPTDPTDPTKVTPDEPVPEIPGYTPSVPTVTPTDPGKDTPVPYTPVTPAKDQQALVNYVDADENNKVITTSGDLSGKAGDKIDYSTATTIQDLENKGYVLVNDGFPADATYDNDDGTVQTYTVVLRHGTQPVTPTNPGKPGEPINPNDPDGPKYPDGSDQVTKNVTRTIQYVDENGNTVSSSVEQPVNFTAEGVLDKVTGQWTTPLTWSIDQTVSAVKSPVIGGYHLVNVDRDAAGNDVAGVTLTHSDNSYTVTVKYAKNGKIIPVDPTGKPIPDVPQPQYPTDPTDPTKVTPNEPVPTIPGYTPEIPTVTPDKPGEDTPVVYHQDVQATVNYIDDVTGQTLKTDTLQGVEGNKSDYSTKGSIANYESQGYKLVSDDFPADGYTFATGEHVFNVHLTHSTSPVDPDHPGAGYSATDLKKTVTRTINYLDGQGNIVANQVSQSFDFIANGTVDNVTHKLVTVENGKITGDGQLTWNAAKHDFDAVVSPTVKGMHVANVTPADQKAGDNVAKTTINNQSGNIVVNVYYASNGTHQDGAKTVPSTQTVTFVDEDGNELHAPAVSDFTFSRTPDVTDPEGNVTEGSWNATSHTYGTVNVPVIPGYVAEVTTAGGKTATIANPNVTDKVVYKKIGKIIPVDPTGKPIPDAPTPNYPNDPTDPTKVTPNEPVPSIPGYTPDTPTVTPDKPTTDTPVTYRQNVQATVTYIDDVTGSTLKTDTLTGLDGKPSDYSTKGSIANYESQGYKLVSDDFPADGYTFSTTGTHSFTVHLTHGTEPVNPEHPGAGYDKTDLQKEVTRTIHFVNTQNGNQVADPVSETVNFTANGTVDKVTGKLVTVENGKITGPGQLTWTPAQDVKAVESPAITGMHVTYVSRDADGTNVKGVSLTHNDSSYDVYVNYAPNGTTNEHGQNIPASQTIKFVDENGTTLRENNVQTSEFTRTPDVVDSVTGKIITEGVWNETSHKFGTINVPVIDGYVAEVTTAGGLTATTDNPNVVTEVVYKKVGKIIPVDPTGNPIPNAPTPGYPNDPTDPTKVTPDEPVPTIPGYTPEVPTVTPSVPTEDTPVVYHPVDNTQNAQVRYIDLTNNEELANSGNLSGQPGDKINYSTADEIKNLEDKGYVLVNDGFPTDAAFDNNKDHDQVFTVTFRHGTQPVTPTNPGKPGEPINPNDPDGPKYPDGSDQVTKDVTRTVQYVDENGNKVSESVEQTVNFTAQGVLDKVTGQWITPLTWSGSKSVVGVKTPVVEGYHVVNVDRDGNGNNVAGVTLTHENDSYTVTVKYAKNGKIIPVDPSGKPIPNVPTPQYPTDPTDPSKVTPDEPVPTIPGYTPSVPTVTPTDPGKDTPVPYTPIVNDQTAVVNYVDQDNNNAQIATSGNLTGKPGSVINYSTADQIKQLENQGYVLVSDGFPAGATFDDDDNTTQTYTVVLKHGQQPVTPTNPGKPGEPINPNDPDGPKYPDGSDQVTKDVTRTIQYVDENGNKVSEPVEQTAHFTGEGVLDKVTGQWITPITWTGNGNLTGEKTPVVEGYHVVRVSRDSNDNVNVDGTTVNYETADYTVTVSYAKNGKIVPVDPSGKPIPNVPTPQYPTDPTDPSKVTPDEPVPTIPGYTPSVPTVTPTDPGKDTPVPYTPIVNDQTAVVNYVDQDNNNAQIATSGNLTGKPGSVINYSTADQIKQLEDQGYVLVSDGFPAGAVFDNDDNTTQTYTVVLKHGTTTFKPDKPGTPGEPINPNYPDGPKVTNEDVDYLKDVKFTVHYVGAGNDNPADNVQNAQWTRSITVDNVTGKIISSTEWVSNKGSYDGVKTPVVSGYHADRAQVDGSSVTMEDQEATVTYVPNGKIIPVDPTGNPIPDVPTPQYPTDPTDPTKVTPDEPVPTIPGYKPEVPTVTPTDPGVDTPVKYTPDTVNPKPAVDQIAIVNYVDQDNNNVQIATSGDLTGKAGSVINYSTADQIKQLEAQGYVLVSDGFPAGATFDDNADQTQVFTVVLKHGHAPVGPNNPHEPGTPVNPDEPNGPKWPAKDTYTKEYTSTVHFVDNNGNKMRDDDVQTSTWTRTLIIDKVTGQVINPEEGWTADKGSYNEVKVPIINGYVADKANVPAKETVQQNLEDTVTYTKVGNIVPVDPNGNPIPNVPAVPYTNDPTDPTKVVPNEPVPSVPGMTPNVTTVTPTHPTVDTPVVYTTPIPVTPETPVTPQPDEPATPEPVQPATPQTPAAPQADTPASVKTESAAPAKQEAKKLPQTGNENNSAAALGLAALGLTGLLAAGKKRRKED